MPEGLEPSPYPRPCLHPLPPTPYPYPLPRAKVAEELGRLGGGGGGEGEGLLGTEEGGARGVGGDEISLRDVDQIKLGCISRLCALGQTFAYAPHPCNPCRARLQPSPRQAATLAAPTHSYSPPSYSLRYAGREDVGRIVLTLTLTPTLTLTLSLARYAGREDVGRIVHGEEG